MCRRFARVLATAVVLFGLSVVPSMAQYNSGSSGIHGAFPPAPPPVGTRYLLWDLKTGLVRFCSAYDTTARLDTCTTEISTAQIPGIPAGGLTTGVFEFSSVDVATASSPTQLDIYPVGYDGPTPLTILVQTSFRLRTSVVLRLDGAPGTTTSTGLQPGGYVAAGGRPGPGGFAGGAGGRQGSPSTSGNPGGGPAGGAGGAANQPSSLSFGGPAGLSSVATSLVPLVGGSGGGGGGAFDSQCSFRGAGAGGGGGAGAVLIAASVQIQLDSSSGISAVGGGGGLACQPSFNLGFGGGGANGNVRLAAPTITGTGSVGVGSGAAAGIVRIEGNTSTFTGAITTIRGTVLGAPQPAIPASLPVLRITSVGGIAVSANPSGVTSAPDVTFQTAPTAPVPVDLAAANIPAGTVVNLRANPLIGSATTAISSALAGTLQSSTASASLQIPAGAGVITAVTSFPVTTAMLDQLPSIPGLTPTTVEVLADASGTSRVFLLSADARRVEVTMGSDGRLALAQ